MERNNHGRRPALALAIASGILLAAACQASERMGHAEPANAEDACVLPDTIASEATCRTYAACCGFTVNEGTMACAFSRAGGLASCECGAGPHKVRCDEKDGNVACQCE